MSRALSTAKLAQDFLENSADRSPAKIGLVCAGRRLTFAELDAQANRLAHALRERGVAAGDRVGLCLKNSVEAVVGIFGVLKAGGTFVAINPATKDDKLAYILRNCSARALILDASRLQRGLAPAAAEEFARLSCIVLCGRDAATVAVSQPRALAFDAVLANFPASRPTRVVPDPDLACLIYTSGTTGEPKGVMSGHDNVVFVAQTIAQYLRHTPDDVILSVLPLAFSYGLYQLLPAFACSATLVLEESFAFPAVVMQKLAEERITGFAGVPTIFGLMVGMDLAAHDFSRLRYFTNAAAALPPEHIRRLREKFPGVALYSMHGLTEVARTLYLPPEELDRRPGSVGIAIPGTEVWLEDDAGRRLPLGETGELIVRGPHVMRGYWASPEASADRFPPGPNPGERVCRSGDLFRTDAEGFFYFVSRKDDIIKTRGEKVAPKEVENVLYTLAGVHEAAVVGMPHPVLGEAVKAIVVPAANFTLTTAQVMAHCRARLEDFMVPLQVEFRTELPKTGSGKILRKELR